MFFDGRMKKYCISKDGKKKYLNCGDLVRCFNGEKWLSGTIQYSMYWNNGYYFLTYTGSKLKLEDMKEVEFISF
mgnify:CR=1 FL=1